MITEEQERELASVPNVIHRSSDPNYSSLDDRVFYPVNAGQLRDLLGKVLTNLDAMGLPDRAHRAAKQLLVQELWRWWDGVYDNSTTSGGSLAPIVMANSSGRVVEGVEPSNRWGWRSEQEYLTSADVAGMSTAMGELLQDARVRLDVAP